jgi:hypothetical protein
VLLQMHVWLTAQLHIAGVVILATVQVLKHIMPSTGLQNDNAQRAPAALAIRPSVKHLLPLLVPAQPQCRNEIVMAIMRLQQLSFSGTFPANVNLAQL